MRDSDQPADVNKNSNERRPPSAENIFVGLLVIAGGFLLLLHQLDLYIFPHWLFRWPTILIAVGLLIGVKSKFQNVGWIILVLVGSFFLLEDLTIFHWNLRQFALPIGIIVVGIFLIFRSVISPSRSDRSHRKWDRWSNLSHNTETDEKKNTMSSGDDYVDATNIFSGTKKRIYSKAFKGGQTTNLFGGMHLDLTQADLESHATIDIVQMFGGVKLLVPANWVVQSDIVAIFGGVEDKRPVPSNITDPPKTLVLTGFCIFGGVDIKSY